MITTTGILLRLFRDYLERIGTPIVRSFLEPVDWSMDERQLEPNTLPCLRYLQNVAEHADAAALPLVEHVARHHGDFRWGQTYTTGDLGAGFVEKYGWIEIFGTRGHFAHDSVAAGLLLLGPHVHYPDHHHLAEEVYIPLTAGAEWRKGDGSFVEHPAGEVIHHPSEVSHAMRTHDTPLLALYLWRGGPLAQKSRFGTSKGAN